MSDSYICLVQIGPVQSFIAAARKVRDLAVGSRLLSHLAAEGVEIAIGQGADMLFPVKHDGSVPHRFAFIVDSDPQVVMPKIKEAIENRWKFNTDQVRRFIQDKIGSGKWEQHYDRQIEQWLDIQWVAVPYQPGDHGGSFQRVGQAMAARKQSRTFQQVFESGPKCTMTGSQSSLPINWGKFKKVLHDDDDILLRKNERLGSLALIKRLAIQAKVDLGENIDRFRDTTYIAGLSEHDLRSNPGREQEAYFAVLHLDGDRMGKILAGFQSAEEHKTFSSRLAAFADDHVPRIVNQYDRAALVYAGGDDVLALLPLESALPCANQLREAFAAHVGYGLHASAGIAVAGYHSPLDAALESAREAEKMAKNQYGRNAVVLQEATSSGQIRQAGSSWEIDELPLVQLMDDLHKTFTDEDGLSNNITSDLRQFTYDLRGEGMAAMRSAELKRLLKRRGEKMSDEERQALHASLIQVGEAPTHGWESLSNWVTMARFLAQGAKSI